MDKYFNNGLTHLTYLFHGSPKLLDIIEQRQRRLWERKIEHDDFLSISLGIGNVEPFVKVRYPETHFTLTENNLQGVLDKLSEETKIMTDVPVAVSFTEKMIHVIMK